MIYKYSYPCYIKYLVNKITRMFDVYVFNEFNKYLI